MPELEIYDSIEKIIMILDQEKLAGKKYTLLSSANVNFLLRKGRKDSPKIDNSFEELEEKAKTCNRCSLSLQRKQVVFGQGSQQAKLMIIADFPGKEDDQTGIPMSNQAGVLFDKILAAMKLSRNEVYLTTLTKCWSGQKSPSEKEILTCLSYLEQQVDFIHPKALVLLGAFPLQVILGKKNLSQHRGQWFSYRGIPCIPTYHPSFLLRVPREKRAVWEDMQQVMKIL